MTAPAFIVDMCLLLITVMLVTVQAGLVWGAITFSGLLFLKD